LLINRIGEIDEEAAEKAIVCGVAFAMKYEVRNLEGIARLAGPGAIQSHIARVFRLDEAHKALDMNQAGDSHGKIILKQG
jgi:NADPH:quinone reductase-like Zn-dependent oxidoreductase